MRGALGPRARVGGRGLDAYHVGGVRGEGTRRGGGGGWAASEPWSGPEAGRGGAQLWRIGGFWESRLGTGLGGFEDVGERGGGEDAIGPSIEVVDSGACHARDGRLR